MECDVIFKINKTNMKACIVVVWEVFLFLAFVASRFNASWLDSCIASLSKLTTLFLTTAEELAAAISNVQWRSGLELAILE